MHHLNRLGVICTMLIGLALPGTRTVAQAPTQAPPPTPIQAPAQTPAPSSAQNSVTLPIGPLTLKQCLQYALQNNQQIAITRFNERTGQEKINETRAQALPQVNATGSLQDNIQKQVLVLPPALAASFGAKGPIPISLTYQVMAQGTLSQQLYNQSVFTALKAAKAGMDYYTMNTALTQTQVIEQVSQTRIGRSCIYGSAGGWNCPKPERLRDNQNLVLRLRIQRSDIDARLMLRCEPVDEMAPIRKKCGRIELMIALHGPLDLRQWRRRAACIGDPQ